MKTPQNTFKSALLAGQQQYGFWLGLCSPIGAELCAHTGYDWVLIDAEHAPNNAQTILAQLQAVQGCGPHPIVRLVEGQQAIIKQYLDLGAQTLLVPMVESAAQARDLVRFMRYPPEGVRGVGTALARAAAWNMRADYLREVQDELCLIVQVETATGVANLQEILAVEGVDAVLVGPADLAASMGHLGNPSHPDVLASVEKIIKATLAAGKWAGTLATNAALSKHYESIGAQFIALGVDTMALAMAARSILLAHQGEEGNKPQEGSGTY